MIELKNLRAGYDKEEKLHPISLSFEEGKVTTIIGPNGCGKSTLLKAASRLIKPMGGQVLLNGQDILKIPRKTFAKQVSILPQVRTVPNITVEGLVMHGRFPHLGYSRRYSKKDKEIAQYAMEQTGIAQFAYKNLLELSGGERQKVYIAMVIAQDTQVVFLDEPTTYLDIKHQFEVMALVHKLNQMGKTVVMVLHDLDLALTQSGHIVLMEEGNLAMQGTPMQLYQSGEIARVFGVQVHLVQAGADKNAHFVFDTL